MKILLFGGTGQLGNSIKKELNESFNLVVPSRLDYDFLDTNSVLNIINLYNPKIIINASAFTDVDQAESNEEKAYSINANTINVISERLETMDCMFIHFSTDYVFDGKKNSKYKETDKPKPINVYGNSKLKGDLFIIQKMSKYLILRTSWVFSNNSDNFVNKILNLASKNKFFSVINDQTGTPTSTKYLAKTTKKLINIYIKDKQSFKFGIYNVSSEDEISWYYFAKYIIKSAKSLNLISNKDFIDIKPILSKDFKQLAKRPKYSSLCVNKVNKIFKIKGCDWKKEILEIMKEKNDK